jgi:hypothetical protein
MPGFKKKGVETMISITDGKWIADLGVMTCRSIEKGLVVAFKRKGETF